MNAIRVVRAYYTKRKAESKEAEHDKSDLLHIAKITGLYLPSSITADEVLDLSSCYS